MEHLSTAVLFSNEQLTLPSTENAAARCSASPKTPEMDSAGLVAHPTTAHFSSQPGEVDTPDGEKMEEDAVLNIYDDKADDDAGGCWKTVIHKRRARQTHAKTQPSENISGNTDDSQLAKRKRSRNKNLPPLPLRDEKIILRPHGGLCLDKWTRPELANPLWSAAGLSTEDCQDIIFRLRPQQNLAIISAPHSHVADALYKVGELSLDELFAPGTQILQARMMGLTNVALVRFEELKVHRYVRLYGAELRCYPHRPRRLVCKICHKLGHWADHCPTPQVVICATCGIDNTAPSHPCTPHCRSCDGPHPTTDPNCPKRTRQTLDKASVRKAIEKEEQRELQPSNERTMPTGATGTRNSCALTTVTGVRTKTRSISRKSRTRSKSRSRSREASTCPPEKRPLGPPSPSSQQPYKKTLQTSASAKVTQAPSETQRNPAHKTATEAPRGGRSGGGYPTARSFAEITFYPFPL
ncbi:hypothetical protein HPB50_011006 [Hyalomma asiaticum]|uniref:Uncharacterized protein n=1 Tax=Hyalomma asiaticum TaxID=266040 RepID=A0ACB7S326_HYAAI|nr:hypothetical protein HPB50_011006 [Hyalomma asiaticum]